MGVLVGDFGELHVGVLVGRFESLVLIGHFVGNFEGLHVGVSVGDLES